MNRLALIFFLIITSITFSEENQWKEGWKYRLTLNVSDVEDISNIEKTASVEFFGKCSKEDGSDIRVFDNKGNELPIWVISSTQENRYQIVFPANQGIYYLYYGNPEAKLPEYKWKLQRGLLLKVYERIGSNIRNWDSVKIIINKSREGKLLGRRLWQKIWDRANPFGEENDTVRIYEGYFYLSTPEELTFVTSSAGPSYILIDEKLIASWEGWHRAEPLAKPERRGEVSLAQGLHKFTYYHIGRRGQDISVAGIKEKNKEKFNIISDTFFLPISKTSILKRESYNSKITSGFEWENTNYLKRDEWEFLTFIFKSTSFSEEEIIDWEWSFGDGQRAKGKEVTHTYFKKGIYPVSLKVEDKKGNTDEITLNIFIKQNTSKIRLPSLLRGDYIKEFNRFNLQAFNNDYLITLAEIYESYEHNEAAWKIYKILNNRSLTKDEKFKVFSATAQLALKKGDYSYAEQVYNQLLSEKPSAEVYLKIAALYIEKQEFEKAEKEFLKILEDKNSNSISKRRALIGIGDIWRIKGDYEKSLSIYQKVSPKENEEIRTGYFNQLVSSSLIKNNFPAAYEKLIQWSEELPRAKLSGNWSILLARGYILNKEYKKAAEELEIVIKVLGERDNIYIPTALYLLGESYEGLGNKEKSKECYKKIIEKYPYSSVFLQSQKKLDTFK